MWGRGPSPSDWDLLLAEARDGARLAHEPMHGEHTKLPAAKATGTPFMWIS